MKCIECGEEVGNFKDLVIHYIPVIFTGVIIGLIIVGVIKIFI